MKCDEVFQRVLDDHDLLVGHAPGPKSYFAVNPLYLREEKCFGGASSYNGLPLICSVIVRGKVEVRCATCLAFERKALRRMAMDGPVIYRMPFGGMLAIGKERMR